MDSKNSHIQKQNVLDQKIKKDTIGVQEERTEKTIYTSFIKEQVYKSAILRYKCKV